MATYPIVVVNETVIRASAPNRRQQMVRYFSNGETTLPSGTSQLITEKSDLTAILGTTVVSASAFATSFYSQGTSSYYVTEVSGEEGTTTIDKITAWLTANPDVTYIAALDATASVDTAFVTLAKQYESNTACLYFLPTLTVSDFANVSGIKSVIGFLPATAAPSTEYGAGGLAYKFAALTPSTTAPIAPFTYQFMLGLTEYATAQQTSLINTALAANANFIIPATAAGLTDDILMGGVCADGTPIQMWYGADYAYLNLTQGLTAAVINGVNNATNPLDYDQSGINTLKAAAVLYLKNAVNVGAILGPITVTAVSFADYVAANPDDYAAGIYNGLTATVVPKNGFTNITFGLTIDMTGQSAVTASATTSA